MLWICFTIALRKRRLYPPTLSLAFLLEICGDLKVANCAITIKCISAMPSPRRLQNCIGEQKTYRTKKPASAGGAGCVFADVENTLRYQFGHRGNFHFALEFSRPMPPTVAITCTQHGAKRPQHGSNVRLRDTVRKGDSTRLAQFDPNMGPTWAFPLRSQLSGDKACQALQLETTNVRSSSVWMSWAASGLFTRCSS